LNYSSFDRGNAAFFKPSDLVFEGTASQNFREQKLAGICPENRRLGDLLGLDDPSAVEDVLRAALLNPLAELAATPGKRIRGQLVALSYRLVCAGATPIASKQCRSCADVVELIHAGSLIIDDIEDASTVRRGRASLHVQYGIPIALNAGNWLYFWPFELLRETGLPQDKIFCIYEHCHRTLLRAHFGQAVDLGTRVDTLSQRHIAAVCLASMKLKTGALMGFAAILGGAVAGAPDRVLEILDDFGREIGVALQMFDDLGNLIGKCEPAKRYEDLKLCRPSWVWACAANHSSSREYDRFRMAVSKLPDAHELDSWTERHDLLDRVRAGAHRQLDAAFRQLKERLDREQAQWSKCAFDELRELGEEIAVAYG
jgi:geranylgeranyl pyrophosphate synthase